jgi:DNA-directed RNA polymerase specialized sigma24 family protein
MATHRPSFHACDRCSGSEKTRCNVFWSEWQNWLRPYVLTWIYTDALPIWQGQESEIADDVLQETSIRILRYINPVMATNVHSIESLESFSLAVAHNCVRDLARRQRRLVRLTIFHTPSEYGKMSTPDPLDFSEVALDQLMFRDILMEVARIIKDFPTMQRRAILIDLAKYADFDEEAGMLPAIFLEMGINLHEYRRALPLDPIARNRHASLLSVAYKRLRQTFYASPELVA